MVLQANGMLLQAKEVVLQAKGTVPQFAVILPPDLLRFRLCILKRCSVPVKNFLIRRTADSTSLGFLPTCYLSSLFNIITHMLLTLR